MHRRPKTWDRRLGFFVGYFVYTAGFWLDVPRLRIIGHRCMLYWAKTSVVLTGALQ